MRKGMTKRATVPMSEVLAELAAKAGKVPPLAERLSPKMSRLVRAIEAPSGFTPHPVRPPVPAGAQPARMGLTEALRNALVADELQNLPKTSQAYLHGFLAKCAEVAQ